MAVTSESRGFSGDSAGGPAGLCGPGQCFYWTVMAFCCEPPLCCCVILLRNVLMVLVVMLCGVYCCVTISAMLCNVVLRCVLFYLALCGVHFLAPVTMFCGVGRCVYDV